MMKTILFDFDSIHSLKSFYSACKEQLQLPGHFGNNLDALWDCITAGIELPVAISFINMSPYHLKKFQRQIDLFRDAAKELDGELTFEYYTKDETDAGQLCINVTINLHSYSDVPAGMYNADGYEGQDVYIIPSKKLVVRQGLHKIDENKFLKEVITAIK